MTNEIIDELLADLNIQTSFNKDTLDILERGESRYIKDLKVNLKNVLLSEYLSEKECALIGLAIAVNEKNVLLKEFYSDLSSEKGATAAEIAEVAACTSLLATNNVLYRFRHFVKKDKYNQLQGKIKMSIMMNPVLGKEFFELVSLAVSAVNGCEMCVNAHEQSVLTHGGSEERIFDAIRISAVITGLTKVIN
jgi:alkyl hydroperoxide reductase subunit D